MPSTSSNFTSQSKTLESSKHFTALPIIDISGLRSDDFRERDRVAVELAEAATNVGFFYISGHGIPLDLSDRLIQCARAYFAQPLAEKMRCYIGNSKNHSGYVPEGEEHFYGSTNQPDLKETYDVNNDLTDMSLYRPMLGPGQWPDDQGFKDDVSAYYRAGVDLGKDLFRGFALALGLDEHYFDAYLRNPPNQLRLIHYPYSPQAQDREGIGAHTDYECFTLLLPTADGLEVLNGAGKWVDAPVKSGCLIVNVGDMMEILSNGRFKATTHRVRKVSEERYSFPLFCTCDYDTLIQPAVAAQGDQQPTVYSGVRCGDHLYAQTIQTFRYLQKRLEKGEVSLPDASLGLSSFGRQRGHQHGRQLDRKANGVGANGAMKGVLR
jgi:isopenicillin N synthase-like dioxygenase